MTHSPFYTARDSFGNRRLGARCITDPTKCKAQGAKRLRYRTASGSERDKDSTLNDRVLAFS